jgi:hypothetical protein
MAASSSLLKVEYRVPALDSFLEKNEWLLAPSG